MERNLLEKLAASHGFAQSAKLSTFAETVQQSIVSTRGLAAEMAKEGQIKSASQNDLARNMGQLVLDRHTIYLYADVLEKPDGQQAPPSTMPIFASRELYITCGIADSVLPLVSASLLGVP